MIQFLVLCVVLALLQGIKSEKKRLNNRQLSHAMFNGEHQQAMVADTMSITPTNGLDSPLEQARQLAMPNQTSTTNGELENVGFWEQHWPLLQDAWKEWEQSELKTLRQHSRTEQRRLDELIINKSLRKAIEATWKSPSLHNEAVLKKLWKPAVPEAPDLGVYQFELLTPDGIRWIRNILDAVSASGIPYRRPNGMNRFGCILDDTTEGAVSLQVMQDFLQQLVDTYVRPLGRMFFPHLIGPSDDSDSYAFTIRYQPDKDVKLNEHADASVLTLNVNLNIPDQDDDFQGSSLYFVDPNNSTIKHTVSFQPGMALIHRGLLRHAAQPIEAGERQNLILWLFGEYGYVRFAPYEEKEQLSLEQRWSKPSKRASKK